MIVSRSERRTSRWARGAALLVTVCGSASCKRAPAPTADASTEGTVVVRPAPAADAVAPRPGMAFVPPGVLRAGTPPDRAPRVADEEPPGEPVEMGGFYIDLLPYPNEPGAIPTSNVTRQEAEQHCASRGKRLCTELEWERACKGDANTTYEYGDSYRAAACGAGEAAEQAARRPTGEHAQCRSGFGVLDMHGGVWEWTSSRWGRGRLDVGRAETGVLRGGNALAGELVSRCANAIGRPVTKAAPSMGFRCCAGEKNTVEVNLMPKGTPGIVFGSVETLGRPWDVELEGGLRAARAWSWTPVPNEELAVVVACRSEGGCELLVGRAQGGKRSIVARMDGGRSIPDLARIGDARHLRMRGLDARGTFSREITYVYGRVELGDSRRP